MKSRTVMFLLAAGMLSCVAQGSSRNASAYVPLDSWVYSAFDRLAALGLVNSGLTGMRPWTRNECARLLSEALEQIEEEEFAAPNAIRLVHSLRDEFASELDANDPGKLYDWRVESIYTRVAVLRGEPLARSYDFGQTISNDFGRPFAAGWNLVSGAAGWVGSGPLLLYLRAEFQHAPSIPSLSPQALDLISTLNLGLPVLAGSAITSLNRVRWLDAYVAFHVNDWQLTLGKQNLWWGPGQGGPMIFSNNAAPVTMLRLDRSSPFKLPWVFGLLGPMRTQFFLGGLSGHEFVYGQQTGLVGQWGTPLDSQPFLGGGKLSFKPTPNFEFGIGNTTLTGGPGMPFDFRKWLQSMFSLHNSAQYGTESDPGDRRSQVDFSYRVPRLRKWLTVYGDAFTEDEFSPLAYPRKSAFQGGIYLPQVPGISKLDLRVEGGSTSPADFSSCNGCFYSNGRYLSGYTNGGNLMGSWLGRAAQGEQGWATYWLNPRRKVQFNYRHRKLDSKFVPGGGTVNGASLATNFWINGRTELAAWLQYEKWKIPALTPVPQSNVTTSIQLTYWPPAK